MRTVCGGGWSVNSILTGDVASGLIVRHLVLMLIKLIIETVSIRVCR